MNTVDLNFIGNNVSHRKSAIRWLIKQYGPVSEGRWKIDSDLTCVEFSNESDATFFILKWR
jgi:hypothetical protein